MTARLFLVEQPSVESNELSFTAGPTIKSDGQIGIWASKVIASILTPERGGKSTGEADRRML
ncbi:hypothetical protein XH87_09460 [Bradyrhizobium sp. CCBAU 53415]|nr:hypothetical protein [Bradyrhizobium sp. CCBAU 53415]